MKPGDRVITNYGHRPTRQLVRNFGIVQRITPDGFVYVSLYDGSTIKRAKAQVAVYVLCRNWDELYRKQEIITTRMMRTKTPYRLANIAGAKEAVEAKVVNAEVSVDVAV